MRDVNTWQVFAPGTEPKLLFERGYTGHEHLSQFGLINMNARFYDPVLGLFISPDPLVGSPDMSNSYNRYVYASNNPLMYVDLDGEEVRNPLPQGNYNRGFTFGGIQMPSNNNSGIIGVNFNVGSFNSGYVGYSGPSGFGNAGSYNSGYSGGDTGLASLIYGIGKSIWSLFHQPKGPELHASGKILAVRKAPQSAPKQTLAPRTESGYQSLYSAGKQLMGIGTTQIDAAANGVNDMSGVESGPSWISQYDSSVPGAGDKACKRACYIMVPYALKGMANGYQVALEKGNCFVLTKDAAKGYEYLYSQLRKGNALIVGVGKDESRYYDFGVNNNLSDHFIVINAITESGGLHFLDPGTKYQQKGANINNILRKNSSGFITGNRFQQRYSLIIQWIGFNK